VGGAHECGALPPASPGSASSPAPGLDPALALVVGRWPGLTGEQRLAILEIVAASAAPEPRPGALRVARC
jgi:hypothetical protein